MIGIKTVEQAVATVAHEIVVGAKAVGKVIGVIEAQAPQIEAVTALIDPRAATIERVGAALIGELQPQVDKATAIGTTLAAGAAKPSYSLSQELIVELESLYASMKSEISAAKATVTGTATPATAKPITTSAS